MQEYITLRNTRTYFSSAVHYSKWLFICRCDNCSGVLNKSLLRLYEIYLYIPMSNVSEHISVCTDCYCLCFLVAHSVMKSVSVLKRMCTVHSSVSSGPDLQIWLTICIAIERYLSMTRYQWAKSRFTQRRVSAFIWGTAGLCLLLNSPFWFLFYLQPELKLDDAASSPPALLLTNTSSSRQTCAQTTSPGDHWVTQTRTISPVGTTAPTSGGGTAPTEQPNWSRGPDDAATAIRTPQPTGDFVRCQTTFYRSEAYSSYSYARLAVVQFGPLLVLVFFNCLLIVITFLHRQRRRRINSRDARHPHAAAAASHNGTHNEANVLLCSSTRK